MKKPLKIGLIVVAVIAIIAIIIAIIFCIAFGSKTAITTEEFKTIMEEAGYTVSDESEQYISYDENILEAYSAVSEDEGYKIQFYVLATEESAESFYDINKEYFENTRSDTSKKTSISFGSYSRYAVSSDSRYKVLVKLDNTAIYINANDDYIDEIKTALSSLGY